MKLRYLPLAAVAGLALLTGCGGSPAAAPTPSPSATSENTASPTPSSEPADTKLASMTILADRTVAADSSGDELASIGYFDDAAASVATLTELFGFEPAIEVVPPYAGDGFIGTRYSWEGLQLNWYRGFEDEPDTSVGVPPYEPNLSISTDVASVGDVTIQGFGDVQVGDSMADLAELYPEFVEDYEYSEGLYTLIYVGQVPVPPLSTQPEITDPHFSVTIGGTTDETVQRLGAPTPNFGA